MKAKLVKLVIVLLCIGVILGVSACLADEGTAPLPGDPSGLPPGSGCKTLEPMPATLGDAMIILATGVLLTLY